jgi:hypothetical protein
MAQTRGHSLALSLPRRFVLDLMTASRSVPLVPIKRDMNLSALVDARRTRLHRPSWCALMTKGFALVAARRPELRRAYRAWPRPRLYEHPTSIASIAVERRFADEQGVFFAQLRDPETRALADLDEYLRRCKEAPVESIGSFRRLLHLSRWPRLIRRLIWCSLLGWSGKARARYLGTLGVTTTSGLGATLVNVISPLAVTLSYGPIAESGNVEVRLMFDHRVLDGAAAARALAELEASLLGEIRDEVLTYPRAERVRQSA